MAPDAIPDGAEVVKRGRYHEVVEPERLVFTYADEQADGQLGRETIVTVTLAEQESRTKLTLHHAGFEFGGRARCP